LALGKKADLLIQIAAQRIAFAAFTAIGSIILASSGRAQ
jgi:hypothetical protein